MVVPFVGRKNGKLFDCQQSYNVLVLRIPGLEEGVMFGGKAGRNCPATQNCPYHVAVHLPQTHAHARSRNNASTTRLPSVSHFISWIIKQHREGTFARRVARRASK